MGKIFPMQSASDAERDYPLAVVSQEKRRYEKVSSPPFCPRKVSLLAQVPWGLLASDVVNGSCCPSDLKSIC